MDGDLCGEKAELQPRVIPILSARAAQSPDEMRHRNSKSDSTSHIVCKYHSVSVALGLTDEATRSD